MNLILFGFKHCGKSTFGKKLAERLSRPFIDTDFLLEEEYSSKANERLTCRQIHEHLGETAFRTLETQTLYALQNVQNSIIAVGGGTVLNHKNVILLQELGPLVYLILDDETLKKRTLSGQLPSYLDLTDKEGSFNHMVQKRKAIYASIRAYPLFLQGKNDDAVLAELEELSHGQ
jgi:shikimate kinase